MSLLHHFISLFVNPFPAKPDTVAVRAPDTDITTYSTADHLDARITSPYTLKRHAELDADFSGSL